jgi:hypothetical protein
LRWRSAIIASGTDLATTSVLEHGGVSRSERERYVSVGSGRSWWIGVAEDGHPLFVQAAPGTDPGVEQAAAGGSGWRAVAPLEFYRTLVEYLESAPEREEAYLEAMEETLEQWERASSS